jgi:ATP-dependent protease HslVU (ClpYQ) peptidase subunit
MRTLRFLLAVFALAAFSTAPADAQSFLDRLGKRVQQRAEEAITRKAEQAVDKAVDKATDPGTYTGDG